MNDLSSSASTEWSHELLYVTVDEVHAFVIENFTFSRQIDFDFLLFANHNVQVLLLIRTR